MKILDTIAAVSTPYGKGGVALIRISGPDAVAVAERVFEPKRAVALSSVEAGKMVYGSIFETSADGARYRLDDGMAVRFAAPYSFTGENTVEISCHGGILVTSKVLSAVLAAGARHAEAGEFTRRAFVSGKIKLPEAEALGKLLEAQTESQLYVAGNGLRGALTEKTAELYDSLRSMLASVYARIDFPDEDLADMSEREMKERLSRVLDKTERLASTYSTGRAINDGVKTVICGRTNAGKSSVYNRLVGYESAIVTDIEGTTRDVLCETVALAKTTLRISDTAGLRKTRDTVENIGIERALREIENAELILAVFDTSKEISDDDREFIARLSELDTPAIAIFNKSDLDTSADQSEIERAFKYRVRLSAKSGEGFEELSAIIDSLFIDGEIDIRNDAVVADARQHASLVQAAAALRSAISSLEGGVPLDLCCIDVETAMQALGELEGGEIGEEIVSEIFSKFCVGK